MRPNIHLCYMYIPAGDVRTACKESLRELGPLLDSDPVNGTVPLLCAT